MKSSNRLWIFSVLALLALRLVIIIRTAAVTGDDMIILTDCFNWWTHGNVFGLATVYGSAGIFYVGFHHFIWATLAGIFSFKLGPLVVAHAVLMVTPALLLNRQLAGRPEVRWAVLLALSSPLSAYLSESLLPIWWVSLFGGTIALQVSTEEERGRPMGKVGLLMVGIASGLLSSIYPSLSILTLGLFLWLIVRQKSLREHAAYLVGCLLGCTPYLLMLYTWWDRLNPRLQVGDGAVSLLQLAGSIFRHLGIPFFGQRANSDLSWLQWEQKLSVTAPWLWLAAATICVWGIAREWHARRKLPATVQLAVCSWSAFLLFSFVTHTERAYHQAGNLWWIPALLLPWAVQTLAPKRASLVLGSVVSINVLGLVILLGPRLIAGTTADGLTAGRGLGASWWMQENIIEQIRARANHELNLGIDTPITVRCEEIYYIHVSIPKLFALQYPSLGEKVRWVVEGFTQSDLVVTRDRSRPNRLRLAVHPDEWHRAAQPARTAIQVSSTKSWSKAVQIGVHLDPASIETLELTAADGSALNYVVESSADGSVWVRLPALARGLTTLWAYHGSGTATPAPPEDVFDFFDGFDGDLKNWTKIGAGKWETNSGICVLSLPPAQADSSSTQLLLDRPDKTSGLIEARLRFPKFKAPVDAGVVFATRPGQHGYLWNFTGYGATMLSELSASGVPRTLTWSEWYWKAKPATWFVIGAEWDGPAMKMWSDGWTGRKTIFDTINPAEIGLGGVGIGAKPGPGTVAGPGDAILEFDWVRVRTSFGDTPPSIEIGATEHQK